MNEDTCLDFIAVYEHCERNKKQLDKTHDFGIRYATAIAKASEHEKSVLKSLSLCLHAIDRRPAIRPSSVNMRSFFEAFEANRLDEALEILVKSSPPFGINLSYWIAKVWKAMGYNNVSCWFADKSKRLI